LGDGEGVGRYVGWGGWVGGREMIGKVCWGVGRG